MINGFTPGQTDGLSADDAALLDRRRAVLGDIYPLFYTAPFHMTRASGTRVFDSAGREYLDAYNNVQATGHSNPAIAEAVHRQLLVMNTHTRYLQDGIVEYAERLTATFPVGMDRVVFTNSGSEANDLAIQIARWRTGNDGIIVTTNAYHGVTGLTSQITPENGGAMPIGPHVRTVDAPDTYRDGDNAGTIFAESVRRAIHDLNRHGHGVSLLVLDTIMSSDGIYPGTPGMLNEAFAAVREAGGLVLADEVQPGMGRSGTAMWGVLRHTHDVDFLVCGKPMAGGLPVGCLGMSSELSDAYAADHRYFNTFGGNPATIAAAAVVLDEVENGLMRNADVMGQALQNSINNLSRDYEFIGDVRGTGLFLGVEIVTDRTTRTPDGATTQRLVDAMKDHGVLISAVGPAGQVLKIRPPLTFSPEDLTWFNNAYTAALHDVATHDAAGEMSPKPDLESTQH